jgi:LPXTG-site transpeptidase (sortase) family protein
MLRQDLKRIRESLRTTATSGWRWLLRPRTVRIAGPAAFAVGIALIVGGLLIVLGGSEGDGGARSAQPGEPEGAAATAFQVPPFMRNALAFLVPALQPRAGFHIVIESLDVNADVVALGMTPDKVPQVPDTGAKVAWYEFTTKPGEGGNAVMAGHVRWAGDPGAFAHLDELERGDEISLAWDDGRESVYEVVSSFEVNPGRPDSLQVMAPTAEDALTLITCGGTFVPDADNPLGGDFTRRMVVRARLVQPAVGEISP